MSLSPFSFFFAGMARAIQAFSCDSFFDLLELCSLKCWCWFFFVYPCILGSISDLIKIVTYQKKKFLSKFFFSIELTDIVQYIYIYIYFLCIKYLTSQAYFYVSMIMNNLEYNEQDWEALKLLFSCIS